MAHLVQSTLLSFQGTFSGQSPVQAVVHNVPTGAVASEQPVGFAQKPTSPAKQKLFLVKQEAPRVRLPPQTFPWIEKPWEMDIGYSKCLANK